MRDIVIPGIGPEVLNQRAEEPVPWFGKDYEGRPGRPFISAEPVVRVCG